MDRSRKAGLIGPDIPEAVARDDPDGSGGHPLIATLIGSLLLLLSASGPVAPSSHAGTPAYALAQVTGAVIAGVAIVWGVAFAITIRKASPAWKVGSFVAIALVSAIVGLSRAGQAGEQARSAAMSDARDIAGMVERVDDNLTDVDAGEGKGPVYRMAAASVNSMLADRRAFGAKATAAGLDEVMDPTRLKKTSPVLGHCDRLAELAGEARTYGGRHSDHLARARSVGMEAVARDEVPQSAVDAFVEGAQSSAPKFKRQWALNAELVEEAAGACRVLARKRWERAEGRFQFVNAGDLAAFNAHVDRIQAINRELAAAQEQARTRVGAELKRIGVKDKR